MTLTEATETERLCFELSPFLISRRGSCCLKEGLGFLTRGWTLCMVQGPWKSVWVINCQSRGEQQQIGLLKLFSPTEELLSACQEPDYSIQLFCSAQSVQRTPRAGPHSYLSIPDTDIKSAASQRWHTEGYRKYSFVLQHLKPCRWIKMSARLTVTVRQANVLTIRSNC